MTFGNIADEKQIRSIPVELVSASRVGNTKQVKMRVDSKTEIDSTDFGKLDSLVGNVGILVVGNDIAEAPSDSYVKDELSKIKVDKVIQGESLSKQLKKAIWKAQLDLRDGERPDPKVDDITYRNFMTEVIAKIRDNPESIARFIPR